MGARRDTLLELYRYVRWADQLMLDAAATMPTEGYYREQHISAGSVHKLLLHAMGGQKIWLSRWRGNSDVDFLPDEQFLTLDAIRAHWPTVHAELFAFLEDQTDESLGREIRYRRMGHDYRGVLWHLITHVADHGTYHRGQINSMIKLGGGRPTDPSFITYRRILEGQPT
jgi:uncharacterized damage-inducible protein DinB